MCIRDSPRSGGSVALLGSSLSRLGTIGGTLGRLLGGGVIASRCGALSIGSSLIGSGRGGIFGTFSALVDALGYGSLSALAFALGGFLIQHDGVAIGIDGRHTRAIRGGCLLYTSRCV